MSKVLIVSFDGMDIDLIRRFELANIPQNEFGTIDNDSGICVKVTSELFVSFLTGKTWQEHGIIGLDRYSSDILNKIESLNRYRLFRGFSGLRGAIYSNLPFLSSNKRHIHQEDYEQSTFLDEMSSSDIGVRGYSKGYTFDLMQVIRNHGLKEAEKELSRFERMKRGELWEALDHSQLVMAHFHRTDHIHHWYWEVGKMGKVEETYHEMDEFAGEILEKAEENGFDTVIFMSDHGLPDVENGGHNENAFYSCNHELFGDETPHITDFHDKILELAGEENEIEGVDV